MRRGPAIGGHLPRVSKTALEQMSRLERAAYHQTRAEILARRAMFTFRIAVALVVISVLLRILSLVLS